MKTRVFLKYFVHDCSDNPDRKAYILEKIQNKLKWWIRNIFNVFAPIKLPPFSLAIFSDANFRGSSPQVFLSESVLKICSKFTGEHPCRIVISIKLLCNFIEITVRHGCSPVNFQHSFRTPLYKSTFGGLLLNIWKAGEEQFK